MPIYNLNGSLVDSDKAAVPACDSGFLYGIGLFETIRVVNRSPFALDDHLDRLMASCEKLDIHCPLTRAQITDSISQTLKANNLSDARVRLTLSRGDISKEDSDSTILITTAPFIPYPDELYKKGAGVILTDYRHNTADPLAGHKTTSYFSRLVVLKEAQKKRTAEALWFTHDGILAEGCVSNVFVVKDSVIYTPRLDTPVLPGIARKHIFKLANEIDINCTEKDLTITDLLGADEVFLTNVVMLALPVIAVEAHTVGDGKPGKITKKIIENFRKLVNSH